jgi:hypothetical protein
LSAPPEHHRCLRLAERGGVQLVVHGCVFNTGDAPKCYRSIEVMRVGRVCQVVEKFSTSSSGILM